MTPTRTPPVMPACCHAAALVRYTSSPTTPPVPTASSRGMRLTRAGRCRYVADETVDSWSILPAGINACTSWPSTEPVTVPPNRVTAAAVDASSDVSTSTETNGLRWPARRWDNAPAACARSWGSVLDRRAGGGDCAAARFDGPASNVLVARTMVASAGTAPSVRRVLRLLVIASCVAGGRAVDPTEAAEEQRPRCWNRRERRSLPDRCRRARRRLP